MRLFVGTLLSASTTSLYDGFIEELVSHHRGALRAIPQRSAHFTYAFCVDADDHAVDAILLAVRQTAIEHDVFEIALGLPHVMPPGGRPRLVCAALLRGEAEIRQLTSDLLTGLRLACPNLPVSPSRTPHVTLARFRNQARRADAQAVSRSLAARPAASVTARDQIAQVQLIASTLTSSGPLYEVRAEVPLAKSRT